MHEINEEKKRELAPKKKSTKKRRKTIMRKKIWPWDEFVVGFKWMLAIISWAVYMFLLHVVLNPFL